MQIDRVRMGLTKGPEPVNCPYGAAVSPGDYLISLANASQINPFSLTIFHLFEL
jgi:hypothetical protein